MRKLAFTVVTAAGAAAAALVLAAALGAAGSARGICPSPGTPHTDAEYQVVLGSGASMAAVRPLVAKAAGLGFKNLEVEHGSSGYVVKLYGLYNRSLLAQEVAQIHKTKSLRIARTDTVFRPCR